MKLTKANHPMLRGQSYLFRAKGEYDENGAMPELTIEQESVIFRIVSEGRTSIDDLNCGQKAGL